MNNGEWRVERELQGTAKITWHLHPLPNTHPPALPPRFPPLLPTAQLLPT